MNADLIRILVAVVAVGVALAGLMLASWRGVHRDMQDMRQDIQGLRQETREEFHEVRQEMRDMRNHMGRIDSHIGELRDRMGHVEGLLTGLRDAFVPRTASE